MTELEQLGARAKAVEHALGILASGEKNRGLMLAAEALVKRSAEILAANEQDLKTARNNNMKEGLIDRLKLTEERIEGIAEGVRQVAALDDPIGEVLSMKKRPNGLVIGQKRVPIGVIGIIYEARPNVTADAFALCFKTGNPVILKGGSDAICSNKKIVEVIREALLEGGLPADALLLIESTDRETTKEFMRLNKYVNVLIPRGSAGLIRSVVENSTIPVIETGSGNCHIYVDDSADFDMALDIIYNAKTQRIGVCNACESLVLHESVVEKFVPKLVEKLADKNVEIRGDEAVCKASSAVIPATEEDWGTEYLDYIISVKTVTDIDEAIAHINKYNTKHSEAIITENYFHSEKFLNEIDAAAVYVNASTRFTDGFEFGFGAEIGISTQKLHARGPMGLKELTSLKYIIYGNGQVRK
ncbi:MAG: glutamate-5-semialdehyde dehydrogenase [Lachnospiraceae bacterium]|nr:glutamate-5-semialdehyde dehydrogenase [Lachnospiraceae bacterium]